MTGVVLNLLTLHQNQFGVVIALGITDKGNPNNISCPIFLDGIKAIHFVRKGLNNF